jgi:hypothetical protein
VPVGGIFHTSSVCKPCRQKHPHTTSDLNMADVPAYVEMFNDKGMLILGKKPRPADSGRRATEFSGPLPVLVPDSVPASANDRRALNAALKYLCSKSRATQAAPVDACTDAYWSKKQAARDEDTKDTEATSATAGSRWQQAANPTDVLDAGNLAQVLTIAFYTCCKRWNIEQECFCHLLRLLRSYLNVCKTSPTFERALTSVGHSRKGMKRFAALAVPPADRDFMFRIVDEDHPTDVEHGHFNIDVATASDADMAAFVKLARAQYNY